MSGRRDQDVQAIKNIMHNTITKINVAQLCRIVNFVDDDHSRINAQPLPRTQSGNKRGMLLNVHVGRLLRPELKIGDVVVVQFLDRSIENWDRTNKDFILSSTRMHSVNDAFVVEVY